MDWSIFLAFSIFQIKLKSIQKFIASALYWTRASIEHRSRSCGLDAIKIVHNQSQTMDIAF